MNKRGLRMLALVLALLLVIPAIGVSAAFQIKLNKKTAKINMAVSKTLTLTTNAPASYDVEWKSGNTAIATVSDGVVTAKKTGTVKVGARVKGGPWAICSIKISNSNKPTSLLLSATKATLQAGETMELTASIKPAGASQAVNWKSSKPAVVSVSASGVLTARKPGTARIRATSTANTKLKKFVTVTVVAAGVPTGISLTPDTTALAIGEKLTLKATVKPDDASTKVKWTTSNSAVATVSTSGVVTAKKAGKVTITATSSVKSSVKASRTLTVSDPKAVTGINITQTDMYLYTGKSTQLSATITPSGSGASVSWSSSNSDIVSVTAAGKVTGRKVGTATITAKAGTKTDNIEIRVLSDERETTLAARYVTSSGAISANHSKIASIYQSAIQELESHMAGKSITAKERANRKDILSRAFLMYDVPWAVEASVRYWSGSTSYVPGRIYFGMPYTQTNRTYYLEKWVNTLNAKKSNGYYTVDMPSTTYPGNDCSSFTSMAQFGYNSATSFLNSTALYSSTQYTTVTDGFNQLVPGDVLVKKGHVALFLYYVSSDRIMVIEQGGNSEPNTVNCNIKSISGVYRAQGYRVRRKVGIGS